jgi:hypothetical protein
MRRWMLSMSGCGVAACARTASPLCTGTTCSALTRYVGCVVLPHMRAGEVPLALLGVGGIVTVAIPCACATLPCRRHQAGFSETHGLNWYVLAGVGAACRAPSLLCFHPSPFLHYSPPPLAFLSTALRNGVTFLVPPASPQTLGVLPSQWSANFATLTHPNFVGNKVRECDFWRRAGRRAG